MKSHEEIRTKFWFALPGGKPARLDERDWLALLAQLEASGWVLVPKEPTEVMIDAAWSKQVADSADPGEVYAAMIAARPKS